MQFNRITYRTENRRGVIRLNRPDKRNAMDDVMIQELTAAFASAGKDPQVKVVVLAAHGPAFCAGADLEYLHRVAEYSLEQNLDDSRQLAHLFRLMYEIRKPVIGAVNGPALAGGCGLLTVCDFVIASAENGRFGYPEVRIGFAPAVVLQFLVKKVGEGKARELILRGNTLTAEEAKEIGLVSMVVAESNVQAAVDQLTDELLKLNSAKAMGLCKEMLSKSQGLNLLDALDFAANMNAAARMTDDCKRGISAFLKKEKVEW